jgi:threonine dehydrogenase-like Zn-dependent dehydrogenase
VIVADVSPQRLSFARRFGATQTIRLDPEDGNTLAAGVHEHTGARGVDCAMEVCGVPEAIPPGLACLRVGGTYVEIGCSFPNASVEIDVSQLLWNRLTLTGVHNYDTRHLSTAVDFLASARGSYPFDELVTSTYTLDGLEEAMVTASCPGEMRVAVLP